MGLLDKILGRKPAEQTTKVTGTVSAGTGKVATPTTGTTPSGTVGRPVPTGTDLQKTLKENQLAAMKKMTKQQLINASYKVAERLGISPWVILKEEWSGFTNDRDGMYKGKHIEDIKHLTAEQKKALVDELFGSGN